jgi:hypothetical protein
MSLGMLFFVIALIFFFLDGIGVLVPRALAWGLFAFTLGMLLNGVMLPFK